MRADIPDSEPCLFTPSRIADWRSRQPKERLSALQKGYDAKRRDYDTREIVAVDGEGVTWNGNHNYTLLADSSNESISCEKYKTLSFETCATFLLRLSGKLVVSFAFSYDVNMMILSLPTRHLIRLQKRGNCTYATETATYRLLYTPRKCLTVSLLARSRNPVASADTQPERASGRGDSVSPATRVASSKWQTVKSVTIWDTFGFFQTSFVKALREWKIGRPEQLELLERMKAKRADFSNEDSATIEAYNQTECALLVDLIRALRDTLTKAGIRLSRWDGAGAIAQALLKQHGVKEHIRRDGEPKEVLNAYFGGRIQVLQLGEIDGPVYNYDVNSAYPWVAARLPSLVGEWRYAPSYVESPYAIWRCRWAFQDARSRPGLPGGSRMPRSWEPILTPFPFRDRQRNIHYPLCGEGWYWSPLVDLAKRHYDFDILEGYIFEPSSDLLPFDFIREAYANRLAYKQSADPRHIVLKLGLNSLYGKTAQGVGWRNSIPPFRSYVWAGLITATAQSALLGAALSNPDSIIAFATDGIYSRERLDVDCGTGLGQWEETIYDRMLIFQPGLYVCYKDGKPIQKTRGYHPKELDWDRIVQLWKDGGPFETYCFTVNRFLTLGVALQTHRLAQLGHWVDSPRELHLRPATGFPGRDVARHCVRWLPDFRVEDCPVSQPYTPKRSNYDKEQDIRRSEELEQPDPLV